jgi:hypothetical protein
VIERPAVALVWSTDLKLGALPAVCVKTGQPAGAAVKFRFVTTPGWAYALHFLICTGIGLLAVMIIVRLVSRVASGTLPYTSPAARRIKAWRWATVGMFVAFPVLLIAALISLGGDTTVAALLWILMLADFLTAIAFWFFLLPRLGPSARVLESPYSQGNWIELRRVHPAFAAAVAEMYSSRLATAPQFLPPA